MRKGDFRSDRDENVDQPERDDRKHWRPYLEYLQRYGDHKRANGEQITDIAPPEYWDERRRNEALKDKPKAA
jgi:hypothetical protein